MVIPAVWTQWRLNDAVEAGAMARRLLLELAKEKLSVKDAAARAKAILEALEG